MEKNTLFFKKYILVLLLLVFNPLFQSTLFSQVIFQDGFESGTLVNWTNLGGSYSYQGVTTTDPAVGTYSLQQTGSSSHYQGLIATLPSSQPTEISWRVKSSTINLQSGYVVIGDNNTTSNNGVIFCYIQTNSNLCFSTNSFDTNYYHPISPNTWYHIELKNINWTNKTYDIYIDGSLVSTSFPFRSTSSNDITSIYSYNFSSGSNAYKDEFIVTVLPNTPPTAVCQNYTAELDPAGNVTITGANVDGGSSDAEGPVTLSVSPDTFDCSHVGIPQTVTLTVTDSGGLTDSCTATVTVEDNLDPVITCPADITQDTDLGACAATVTVPAPTFTDNCFDGNGCLQTDDIDSYVLGPIFGQDPLWPTWSDDPAESAIVSNEQALSGTQSLKVIGIPAGGPVDQLYLLGDKTAGVWEVTYHMYIPVGNTALTNIQKFQTAGITWANQVYYNSDGTGDYLVNNTLTSFTFPQDSWFEVKQFVDLDNDLTIVYIDENIITSHPFSLEAFSNSGVLQLGAIDFYPYTDANDPNPAATPLFYIDNVSLCAVAVNDFNNTADASDVYPVGVTNVVWTITDGAGNIDSCTQVITVEDNEPPVIVCPADLTAYTENGECSAVVFFQNAIVLINPCESVTVYQTAGLPSGSVFPIGDTLIEFTAQDDSGNLSTCTFTITVEDDDDPIAVCQNITVQLDEFGDATIIADQVNFGSSDNCGIGTLSIDIDTFDCSDVGDNDVTLTVTDVNGNTSTCVAVVTVEDVTDPEVTCNDITVELDANGTVTIDPMDVAASSSDACGIASYELNIDTFGCLDVGDSTVVLTVTDVNGNQSSCSATVTVEDNTSPELVCVDTTIELGPDGTANISPADVATVSDACGVLEFTIDVTEVSCADIGTPLTVNVFANDGNGNSSFCSATVTVVDALGPDIVCPGNQVEIVDPNGTYTLGDYIADGSATATDNCTEPVTSFTQDPAAGTLLGPGVYIITFTAEDEYGNVSICSFELFIQELLGTNGSELSSLVLYPNPADNYVHLSNPNNLELFDVTIYDLIGRMVNKVDLTNMGAEKTLDISELANATYMVLIRGAQGTITKQLIVNNY